MDLLVRTQYSQSKIGMEESVFFIKKIADWKYIFVNIDIVRLTSADET
jgi:hypothetical protein